MPFQTPLGLSHGIKLLIKEAINSASVEEMIETYISIAECHADNNKDLSAKSNIKKPFSQFYIQLAINRIMSSTFSPEEKQAALLKVITHQCNLAFYFGAYKTARIPITGLPGFRPQALAHIQIIGRILKKNFILNRRPIDWQINEADNSLNIFEKNAAYLETIREIFNRVADSHFQESCKGFSR